MDDTLVRYLAQLGVGGAFAGLLLVFYRKDVQHYTDLWRGQSEMVVTVVKENTAAFTANTEILRQLHERMTRLEDDDRRVTRRVQ